MADNIVIRVILSDEASRKLGKVSAEIDDLGDSAADSSRDVDVLNRRLKKTGDDSKKTKKEVGGLTQFFGKLNTNVKGLGYVLKAAKIPAILGAFKMAIPAVGALTAGLGALIGTLGPLSGAAAAIPALGIGLLSVIGVTKMATKGIGDAVQSLTKSGATAEEVAAAMKGLSPPARQLAKNLAALKPEWDALGRGVAEATLPGFNDGLRNASKLLPVLKGPLQDLGATIGDVARQGGLMISSGPWRKDIQTLMGRNRKLVEASGGALLRIVDALRNVMVAAKPFTDALTVWIDQFGRFVQRSSEAGRSTGSLTSFFQKTVDTMRTWGHILRDVSMALFNILKIGGGGLGKSMVGSMEKITAQFRAWTESEGGIARITGWFDRSRPILSEMGALVVAVGQAMGRIGKSGEEGVVPFLKSLREDALPAIEALITGIDTEKMGVAISQLAEAFAKFTNFASFQPLIDGLSLVAVILNTLLDTLDAPGFHQAATAFIGAGLALKTLQVAAKYSGLTALSKQFTDADSMGRRFAAGIRGAEEGQKGFASAIGRATTKLGSLAKKGLSGAAHAAGDLTKAIGRTIGKMVVLAAKTVIATAKMVAHGAVLVATKAKQVAVAVATGAWTAAQWLLNVALNANPIGLIILAIAGLVAGLVYAYQNSETFRNIVTGAFDAVKGAASAVWNWISTNWPLLLAILTGPIGLAVLAIVRNWDKIKNGASAVWNWVSDQFNKLVGFISRLPGRVWSGIERIMGFFTRLKNWVVKMVDRMLGPLDEIVGKIGGLAGGVGGFVGQGISLIAGDTTRPRAASSGNLANTMATHAAVSAATPGRQQISNVAVGGFRGSDHHRGKAVDVVGPNLNTYVRKAKEAGGYAAIHGSGQRRHAHAAYGDTVRTRAPRGSGGGSGATLSINGPLIGQVVADSELDVERAIKRGLDKWVNERLERR